MQKCATRTEWFFPGGLNKGLLVLFFWLCLGSRTAGTDTDDFFAEWEERLVEVRDEIQRRLNQSGTIQCECALYACGNDPGSAVTDCLKADLEEQLECGVESCGYMKLSTSREYVMTSPNVTFGSFTDAVERDICLTQGLARTFSEARRFKGGFEPWMSFGSSETGTFVSWPGKPRRQQEDDAVCSPYDPRLQPWWRLAAWQKRHVVILLDLSTNMSADTALKSVNRWDLTIQMIRALLQTMNKDDNVQIVTFTDTPSLLYGETLQPATDAVIEELNAFLDQTKADWGEAVDIGKAIDKAFQLLSGGEIDQKCEKHVVLFTANRDCTASTLSNCNAKIVAGKEDSEFIVNATALTLDYVENQRNVYRGPLETQTLFAYSLSPNANGMMSQLACRLDGIHVDLERELRNRIVDPFHLMRGYFRRAAFPIAKAFESSNGMAISEMYDDTSGLGRMNTFVMPVFHQPHENCPPIHYGVIAADMPVSEYNERGIQMNGLPLDVNRWNEKLEQCQPEVPTRCELQVIRGEDGQCVYPLDDLEGPRWYRFANHYYYVDDVNTSTSDLALSMCADMGGVLIAPKDALEKKFLVTVIPPDGAWINLTQVESKWVWPDGEELESNQGDIIARTCKQPWSPAFFMDPRGFDDNFQCSQKATLRTVICKFPGDSTPPALSEMQVEAKRVEEKDFNNTIKSCEMESCLPPTDFNFPDNLICNRDTNDKLEYSSIACCSEKELNDVCTESPEEEESGNGALVGIVVVVAVAIAIGIIVFACWLRCKTSPKAKGSKTHMPLTSTESSQRNNVEMVGQGRNNPDQSPFMNAACISPAVGRRPELVVNIEVTLLDNGWEKAGGYGRVRQGEYTDATGNVHKVAVKFVDALAPTAAWEALKNEFDILASIPLHPNIVKPIGAHYGDRIEKTNRYIVEELMHTNLGDLMARTEPHPYPGKIMLCKDWIKIFMDITRGLEHLHIHKIIHFDLKPRNVLLDEEMNAKIADFGCSKSKFDTYIQLSQMGGTPPYLAPECWMLYYDQNCRTEVARVKIDIYSLGVIMWECLSGGSGLRSALYTHTEEPSSSSRSPAHPENIEIRDSKSGECSQRWVIQYHLSDEIPECLRNLVNHCVRIDFDARPTCSEILETLEAMLEEEWINRPLLSSS